MNKIIFLRSFFRVVLLTFFSCFFHVDVQVIFPILKMDGSKMFCFEKRVGEKIRKGGHQWLYQCQRVAEKEQYGNLFFHTPIYGDSGVAGLVNKQ